MEGSEAGQDRPEQTPEQQIEALRAESAKKDEMLAERDETISQLEARIERLENEVRTAAEEIRGANERIFAALEKDGVNGDAIERARAAAAAPAAEDEPAEKPAAAAPAEPPVEEPPTEPQPAAAGGGSRDGNGGDRPVARAPQGGNGGRGGRRGYGLGVVAAAGLAGVVGGAGGALAVEHLGDIDLGGDKQEAKTTKQEASEVAKALQKGTKGAAKNVKLNAAQIMSRSPRAEVREENGRSVAQFQAELAGLDNHDEAVMRGMHTPDQDLRFVEILGKPQDVSVAEGMKAAVITAANEKAPSQGYLNNAEGRAVDAARGDSMKVQLDKFIDHLKNPKTEMRIVTLNGTFRNWGAEHGRLSSEVKEFHNLRAIQIRLDNGEIMLLKITAEKDPQLSCINILEAVNAPSGGGQRTVTTTEQAPPSSGVPGVKTPEKKTHTETHKRPAKDIDPLTDADQKGHTDPNSPKEKEFAGGPQVADQGTSEGGSDGGVGHGPDGGDRDGQGTQSAGEKPAAPTGEPTVTPAAPEKPADPGFGQGHEAQASKAE